MTVVGKAVTVHCITCEVQHCLKHKCTIAVTSHLFLLVIAAKTVCGHAFMQIKLTCACLLVPL